MPNKEVPPYICRISVLIKTEGGWLIGDGSTIVRSSVFELDPRIRKNGPRVETRKRGSTLINAIGVMTLLVSIMGSLTGSEQVFPNRDTANRYSEEYHVAC